MPANAPALTKDAFDAMVAAILDREPSTQDVAIAQVEGALMEMAQRPLTAPERVKIGIVVALAWNARFPDKRETWFNTADGKYLPDALDRTLHQDMLDAKRDALRARLARIARQMGEAAGD